MLEVHAALSREMFGPDVVASVTTAELRQLVDGVRFIERMRAHPVDKDASARDLTPLRQIFTRSLVARQALPAGTVLTREHLAMKKPGTGLSPDRLEEVVGRRLRRAVEADQLLAADDIEGLTVS
jgi:N-acetylneuraminate synthase